MDLIYSAGDIVFFNNVMFDDPDGKKRIDMRISGHPYLVLNDVENLGDKCYALKITSRKLEYIKQYPLPINAAVPRLRKKSFVNLDKVFEFTIEKNIVSYSHLRDGYFNNLSKNICKN